MKKFTIVLSILLIFCLFLSGFQSRPDDGVSASAVGNAFTDGGKIRDYADNGDGTWSCDGITYRNKYTFTGWLPKAAKVSTYVVLSNSQEVTFHDVWWSIFTSDSNDFLDPEETILVELN